MPYKKKEEANDILQYLIPKLDNVGIHQNQCKIDTTTDASGNLRGDVWLSRKDQATSIFEKNIVGLIEAKHRNCSIGDTDWRDAIEQGKIKGKKQSLTFYIVTNCTDSFRFYNIYNDNEITLDGTVISKLQSINVLEKIQAQITVDNSQVFHQIIPGITPISEDKFRKSLLKLADIYRSCGLKKGDERIDPSISFVILKYIGEKEKVQRTLSSVVKIWFDYGSGKGNYKADFMQSCKDIFSGEYGDTYKDFEKLVSFPNQLANDHYRRIWEELNQYHFHGCSFDIFGAIYEEFASQTKKREFGEFYTRRHITGVAARLLLRKEITGRDLKIGDPAC
jgi:type I restriction enzyme M protein